MKVARYFRIGVFVLVAGLAGLAIASAPTEAQQSESQLKKEELEGLLAPIALYPDALLAQVLMASTYPLEIVQAARWAKANPKVTGKALEDAMAKQSWDPSVKALTAVPQALQMMSDKLDWTQQLGDAFLAQKSDVLAAVQSLRARAKAAAKLESTKEMKVSTSTSAAPGTTAATPEVIVIESAQPSVVYVPTYNPTVVYGAWPYPAYPPYYYYPPGYVAAASAWSFAAGVVVGSALWGNCNWHRGDVNINVNQYNSFNRTNISNNQWNHNELHRKGVPYSDKAVAQQYNKGGRSEAAASERYRGRQEASRPSTVDRPGTRPNTADRPGGADRPAARPNTADRLGGATRSSGTTSRPTGMNQPHATQNLGRGSEVQQHSQRGASSRSQSVASYGGSRTGAAPSAGAARGGRR